MGFLSVLVGTTILLNYLFLDEYYMYSKNEALYNSYLLIQQLYQGDIEAIDDELSDLQDKNNMIITILSASQGFIYPYSDYTPTKLPNDLKSALSKYNEDSKANNRDHFLILEDVWVYDSDELFITLQTPISAIDETINVVTEFFTVISITISFLGVILVSVIANRLTRPIEEITSVATNIANLQFDQKLESKSQDELGQLTSTINLLSVQLQKHIFSLEDDIKTKENLEEVRKQFISNVSHELKTPLSLILGYTEGLKVGLSKEDQDFYCEVIEDETIKMSKLVNKLLQISQMESGQMELCMEEFDLLDLVESILKKNLLRFKEKNTSYTIDINLAEIIIEADYDYVEQVVTNYLSNALAHVEANGNITIRAYKQDCWAVIEVINSGSHIPHNEIDNIWDSFYKVNKARTREYGGHGLGLYIVKMILDMHQGEYYVFNTTNGVCFGVRFRAKN